MNKLALLTAVLLSTIPNSFAQEYSQAPGLDASVADGTLPSVEDRLPAAPDVLDVLEGVGTYGGALRFGLVGASDHPGLTRFTGAQNLVRWAPDRQTIVPNLAESWEVDAEGKVFTFKLREGLKWSDGTLFTADDISFNIEDLILNSDFGSVPSRFTAGGEPIAFEKIDDLTFTLSFAAPYGSFPAVLARPESQAITYYSKNYCSQFHPDYNENIVDLVSSSGASDWQNLLLQKCGEPQQVARWGNPERPTMDPWIIEEPYTGGATLVTLERNPYFWQVDAEGNQLPYIDRLEARVFQESQALVLAAIGGQIDWQLRQLEEAANRPVLAQNREAGDYQLQEAVPAGGLNMTIMLNLTHQDEVLRDLFNEKDFRVALSHGIDRQAIIDTAMLGVGQPWQGGSFEDDPAYDERLSTEHLAYDVDQANALLDGLGLTERNGEGIRLMSDGRPVKFQIDVVPSNQPEWVDMLQLMERGWTEIGVDMDLNVVERSFFVERTDANAHDAAVWGGGSLSFIPGQVPWGYVPIEKDAYYGKPWVEWFLSEGEEGIEPPQSVKDRVALWAEAAGTPDRDKQYDLFRQIAESAADDFFVMGVSKSTSTYGIVKNGLANVPAQVSRTTTFPDPSTSQVQTWFWSN